MSRRAQSLNPNRANRAASLSALSGLLNKIDLPLEALECSKKGLECEERERGKNAFLYANLQEQIGTTSAYLGKFDVALSRFHRARAGLRNLAARMRIILDCCWPNRSGLRPY